MTQSPWSQGILDFVACPNHNTNEGWNKLRFIGKDLIKCDLCEKEFTVGEIKEEIKKNYAYDLQHLQRNFAGNLASLQYMNQEFGKPAEAEKEEQ